MPLDSDGIHQHGHAVRISALCKKAVEAASTVSSYPTFHWTSTKRICPIVKKYDLRFILLVTPETPESRVHEIDEASTGFVYMVSSASTTGAQQSFNDKKQVYFKKIEGYALKNPTLVGFGVSNKETLMPPPPTHAVPSSAVPL